MKHIFDYKIFEAKAVRLPEKLDREIIELTTKIWSLRKSKIKKKEFIEVIQFKTLDGADGLVQVWVDPNLVSYYATIDTEPLYSGDPLDFVMYVCSPDVFSTKKDLYNIIYHEMIHAVDPTQSTKFSSIYLSDLNWWDETKQGQYYGHESETRAIFGEFINSLYKAVYNTKFSDYNERNKCLDEIVRYFSSQKFDYSILSEKSRSILRKLGKIRGIGTIRLVKTFATTKVYNEFLKKLYHACQDLKIESR